jgi:amino-acid N-acetyltransferase
MPEPAQTSSLPASGTVVPRPATADDVDALHQLIDVTSRTTTVLPRSRDNLCRHLRDFLVARQGDRVVACGALALFTPNLAEVKTLVVAPELRGRGMGGLIVRGLLDEARRLGIRRVFALTDNPPFFQRQGFRLVDKATLPHKVWNECIRCPKFLNCQEEAVDIILPADGGAASPSKDQLHE